MGRFYWRFMRRQWRLAVVKLFFVSLTVVSAAVFASALLNDRLERSFSEHSKEILASDLVLESTTPLSAAQETAVQRSGLQIAQTLTFPTMLHVAERFLLVSLKAVSAGYPLRGQLQVAGTEHESAQVSLQGPAPGEVWVETRVLHALDLSIGSTISIGAAEFLLTRILLFEPDRAGNFYNFIPRVMLHQQDVAATNILKPGSRLKYRYLFAGSHAAVSKLKDNMTNSLLPNQRFISAADANNMAQQILTQIQNFLHISSMLTVLLGILGVGLASYQYSRQLAPDFALLRSLGCAGITLRLALLLPLASLALLAGICGWGLGAIVQIFVLTQLGQIAPSELPPPGIMPFLSSGGTVLAVVAIFAWGLLYKLARVDLQDMLDRSERQAALSPAILCGIFCSLFALVLLSSGSLLWSAAASLVFFLFAGLCYVFIQIFLRVIARYARGHSALCLGWRLIKANQRLLSLQIITIATSFFVINLMLILTQDLTSAWLEKIPPEAPNFFVFNLSATERTALLNELDAKQIAYSPFYPVIRGRLSGINGQPIRGYVSKESERSHESLHRDLSLSYAMELPLDNQILAGQWHTASPKHDTASVSVESKLADKLDIKVGDSLEYTIAGVTLTARVSSLRTVEWESFSPNFYMLFAPGDLDDFATTYLASMYVDAQHKAYISELIKKFPAVTFIDVDFILARIRAVISRANAALLGLLCLSVLMSLVVFVCVEMILQKSRLHYIALFKALGADTKRIRNIFTLQFWLVGGVAGLFAYLSTLTVGSVLITLLLDLSLRFNIIAVLLCLFCVPLLVWGVAALCLSTQRSQTVHVLWGERSL